MRPPGIGELLFILILVAVVFAGARVNWMGDIVGGFVRNLRQGLRNDDRIQIKPPAPTARTGGDPPPQA